MPARRKEAKLMPEEAVPEASETAPEAPGWGAEGLRTDRILEPICAQHLCWEL